MKLNFVPLELPQKRKQDVPRSYWYASIDDDVCVVRITFESYSIDFIIDTYMIEHLTKEVSQLYVITNRANVPYISANILANKKKNVRAERMPLSRYALHKRKRSIKVDEVIDHINGNTLDNRIENLRATTHSNNMRNRKQQSNQTGYRGVYPRTCDGKYDARLMLGTFDTPEEAHEVYKKAYKKIFPKAVSDCKW